MRMGKMICERMEVCSFENWKFNDLFFAINAGLLAGLVFKV